MSTTDADPVQPAPGQGEEGTADAPYAEYLDRIPEEVRGDVEPVFKDWDANVTRRFQEHSEYRKTWEPYQDSGVTQYDPEAVQNALAFYQAATNDPQAIKQWYEETYAPAHNLLGQQPSTETPPELGGEYGAFDQQQLSELLKQQLSPVQQQLEELASWRQQQDEAAQVAAGQAVIDQQISELKSKHGEEFTPKAQEWVMSRAQSEYISDPQNAIPRAWEDFRTLVNELSKQVLQSKVNSPAPAEGGGVPDVAPEQHKTLKEAEAEALEILRNSNRA